MASVEQYLEASDLHPIDVVETLAEHYDWAFDRVGEDQIAMAIEGAWRTYSITLAWSAYDETLRMICTFEMDPPEDRLPILYEAMNLANDKCWAGAFSLWKEQRLMVYRYGLMLGGGQMAVPEQIDQMLSAAVVACERFYPAFQLVAWGNEAAEPALEIAMSEAYGRA
ncbi:YbjN domain-containing protein [Amylibacter sp. IMCC11727]|uniref:YbjN domain-containing protein n=1 Tax=Amylibacter sp. IMCC11727 TaxID=3039851 RepID=UPI00244DE358|nr:YbjN domain-containing protein [Amylibacter sp. IMCC11727]WGI23021.1 YbjN domain-containing protein [Amylibacter sp. IMCC11727]